MSDIGVPNVPPAQQSQAIAKPKYKKDPKPATYRSLRQTILRKADLYHRQTGHKVGVFFRDDKKQYTAYVSDRKPKVIPGTKQARRGPPEFPPPLRHLRRLDPPADIWYADEVRDLPYTQRFVKKHKPRQPVCADGEPAQPVHATQDGSSPSAGQLLPQLREQLARLSRGTAGQAGQDEAGQLSQLLQDLSQQVTSLSAQAGTSVVSNAGPGASVLSALSPLQQNPMRALSEYEPVRGFAGQGPFIGGHADTPHIGIDSMSSRSDSAWDLDEDEDEDDSDVSSVDPYLSDSESQLNNPAPQEHSCPPWGASALPTTPEPTLTQYGEPSAFWTSPTIIDETDGPATIPFTPEPTLPQHTEPSALWTSSTIVNDTDDELSSDGLPPMPIPGCHPPGLHRNIHGRARRHRVDKAPQVISPGFSPSPEESVPARETPPKHTKRTGIEGRAVPSKNQAGPGASPRDRSNTPRRSHRISSAAAKGRPRRLKPLSFHIPIPSQSTYLKQLETQEAE